MLHGAQGLGQGGRPRPPNPQGARPRPEGARQNRLFMHRAVNALTALGVTQFLDIGTGIPTEPNLHQVAQAPRPPRSPRPRAPPRPRPCAPSSNSPPPASPSRRTRPSTGNGSALASSRRSAASRSVSPNRRAAPNFPPRRTIERTAPCPTR
nr:SAM-dependent methyltransferase [Nocardia abscessus]